MLNTMITAFFLLSRIAIPQPLTAGSALYQDPLPTPTPEWLQAVALQPGAQLLLERRISYGDIAVVIAIIALAVLILFIAFVAMPKLWKVE